MTDVKPLAVELTGVPGPKVTGVPFDSDPRVLWRVDQYDHPLELGEIRTRRRVGFDGRKKRGLKTLAERADLLAELQELLWAHHIAAPKAEKSAVLKAIAERAPRIDKSQKQRRSELFDDDVEHALEALDPGPRVLLVLQGMDASGKGGMVKSVVGTMDPLGVDVTAFGKPTKEEQSQHYLQRIIAQLPAPGHVGVFDRSHYEDVLVPAVNRTLDADELALRVETLQLFEQELVRHGFVMVKVMLHISAKEQLERLISRLDREHKHWKYDPSDAQARKEFDSYRTIYSGMLEATDADHAPWHVVGADRKWYSRLAVQEILIGALADLNLKWPAADYDIEVERQRLLTA